jgi:RsiW-degrading membrane proteinase PrsW (M82 family)
VEILRFLGKALLVVAALVVGLALFGGLPLVAYLLLYLLLGSSVFFFFPGLLLYLLLICLPFGLVQWIKKASGQPSGPLRLPSVVGLVVATAAAIVSGQLLLVNGVGPLFWFCFLLAAALPPLAALALASQRLGPATTWRRMLAGLLAGSLLSTNLTILLSVGVSMLAYFLVLPLRDLVTHLLASPSLEKLFFSPALVFAFVGLAIVAPLVEELVKPLGALLLAKRLRGPDEAFLVGMAGGVGFAIVENMLYEAAGNQLWAHITVLRASGGVLHPLTAGLVAVGWYGVRQGQPGGWRRLSGLYGLAVGIHALWNGGLTVLMSSAGAYFFGTDTWRLNIYGVGQPGVVAVFMVLEAVALWWLLLTVTARLRAPGTPALESALSLHLEQPRRLALWATGLVAVLVPIGALYGPLLSRYAGRLLPFG